MKSLNNLILLSVISGIFFIILFMNIAHNGFLTKLDLSINNIIQSNNNFLISSSKLVGFVFDTLTITIISLFVAFFIWYKYSKKESVFFLIVMLIGGILIDVVKEIGRRVRPINDFIYDGSFSFPSGTTAIAVIIFGLLIYIIFAKVKSPLTKNLSIFGSVIIILFVGFTRIYLGVHWLSDVTGGFSFGLFILTTSVILKEVLKKHIATKDILERN